LVGQLF